MADTRIKLPDEKLKALLDELRAEARRLGGDDTTWTALGVAQIIKRRYGIEYHPRNLWRRMKRLGWGFKWNSSTQEERFAKFKHTAKKGKAKRT